MGISVISVLIFIFLSILLSIGIIYLAYWIPKKFGKRKLGIWLSGILTLGLFILILSIVFTDELFFKYNAREKLSEHNFVLLDEFDIISNEKSIISEGYHHFKLTISAADKELLIRKILTDENYKENIAEVDFICREWPYQSLIDTSFTINYQDNWAYIYEFYKPNKPGYSPISDKISISKSDYKLTYERNY